GGWTNGWVETYLHRVVKWHARAFVFSFLAGLGKIEDILLQVVEYKLKKAMNLSSIWIGSLLFYALKWQVLSHVALLHAIILATSVGLCICYNKLRNNCKSEEGEYAH
ncbi:MAG TPA: hypothetical protein VNG51_20870, partial [Ktedonobacteraceae bacterium]|nr:hypothetical protein [Ktedonobacteraceae bacterium]